MIVSQPPIFTFTEDYRNFLETVIFYFRASQNSPIVQLTPEIKHLYRFDLEGFLLDRGVPISEHYLIMRINELENLHNLDTAKDYLLLPDPDLLRNINSVYKSKMKK